MEQLTFDVGETPEIAVTIIGGDLRLAGWEQSQVMVEADDSGSLHVEPTATGMTMRAAANCAVRVPRRASLTIERVSGDARIKSVEGVVALGSLGGDLILRQVGAATAGQVGGDVSAKKVSGALRIDEAGGDVSARAVAGDVTVGEARGDLYLRDVGGGIRAQSRSDVILHVAFAPGREYVVEAAGDMACRVPVDSSVQFAVEGGADLNVEAMNAQIAGSAGNKSVTLGNGEAKVRLKVGGDTSISNLAVSPDDVGDFGGRFGEEFGVMAEQLSEQIESQIEQQMSQFEQQLSERLSRLGDVAEVARRRAEEAQRRIERHAEAAQRRAEAAQHRAERGKRPPTSGWMFEGPRPPTPPTPPAPPRAPKPPWGPKAPATDPVSDEERMSILRMLEQGKINVAQAEKLLAALEGKG
ncbi:MAG: hypothetical protein HY872_16350 [Chloroflexi bacterium]|nr:hypothetical protein [Chloroflexota bacterium]